MTIRPATGLIAWYIRATGCHLEQIERDGRVVFAVKYLWWLCRYGYWNNPYEVEARAAEWKDS